MLENDDSTTPGDGAEATAEQTAATTRPRRRRAASRPAGPPEPATAAPADAAGPAAADQAAAQALADQAASDQAAADQAAADQAAADQAAADQAAADQATADQAAADQATADQAAADQAAADRAEASAAPSTTPQFTDGAAPATTRPRRRRATAAAGPPAADIFTTPAAGQGSPDQSAPDEAAPAPAAQAPTATAEVAAAEPVDAPAARAPRARRGRRRPAEEAPEGTSADETSTGTTGTDTTTGGEGGTVDADRAAEQAAPATSTDPAGPGTSTEEPADGTPTGTAGRPRRTRRRATSPATAPAEAPDTTDAGAPAAGLDLGLDALGSAARADQPDDGDGRGGDAPGLRGVPDLADLADLVAGQEPSSADDGDEDETEGGRARRGGRSRRRRGGRGRGAAAAGGDEPDADGTSEDPSRDGEGREDAGDDEGEQDGAAAGRGTSDDGAGDPEDDDEGVTDADEDDEDGTDDSSGSRSSRRRRRRRRRSGGGEADLVADPDDPPGTVVRIRESRADEVTKVKGSTRLEAKRQRRRDGRTTSRKRTVITEAEFLTRRESVDRTLLVREGEDRTEIAVLEDGVLVEHHVTRASQQSMIGNVYLGRVQNVLPSMEAAFVDIGRGRNAVLYAGEVNWDAVGLTNGAQRKIEDALKPGDPVLGQVSKDPVGHKGARLTAQVSLPGRYLVYVPGSSMTGISRKLPETERARLKKVLRRVVPEDAGVIVRTAAEGASEAELERDVARLQAQWEDIEKKSTAVQAPARLYSEPDLAIKVVRDVFNEDFTRLVVSGDETWETLDGYVRHVAPDLAERMTRWTPEEGAEPDLFVHHRIDEQIAKALDRKVWLPSGGSLVIDRTEAMTVVDVNTGKYTGNGGNLEETVTRNNLEAAEEIVRQLRLRDIGGIIVVDFIDMVLESNRNLVLRRLVECLGRDRTKHQVAEVTSLGLVQLTRKRVGSGLLESFSTVCEHCQGRGLVTHSEPVGAGNELPAGPGDTGGRGPGGGGHGGGGGGSSSGGGGGSRRRGGRSGG